MNSTCRKLNEWNMTIKSKSITKERIKNRHCFALSNIIEQATRNISNEFPIIIKRANALRDDLMSASKSKGITFDGNIPYESISDTISDMLEALNSESENNSGKSEIKSLLDSKFEGRKYAIYLDLEMTTDERVSEFRNEIIEFGFIVTDRESGEIVEQFEALVKPIINPNLTPICMKITGISQCEVDLAETYPEVVSRVNDVLKKYQDSIVMHWGGSDIRQINKDSFNHEVHCLFSDMNSIDAKKLYKLFRYSNVSIGLRRAVELEGIEDTKPFHRALNDSYNMYLLIKSLLETVS